MNIINKNKLITILAAGIILVNITACTSKTNEIVTPINNNPTVASTVLNNDKKVVNSSDTKKDATTKSNNQPNQNIVGSSKQTTSVSKEDKEKAVVDYFKNLKDDVSKYVNEENIDKAKNKIDAAFIATVDFIFYNKEINGMTFSSLSNTAKKEILDTAKNINSIIIKKYPNYQVVIKGKTEKIGNYIGSKVTDAKEIIKDKIGDEKYNDIKEGYEEAKDKASDVKSKTLNKLKNWYENKKNNSK